MDTPITFADLITPAGAIVAAGIITSAAELLKRTFGVGGHVLAFALTAGLYVLAGIAVGVDTLDEGLTVFLAFLGCATAAVGIHSTVRTVTAGRQG